MLQYNKCLNSPLKYNKIACTREYTPVCVNEQENPQDVASFTEFELDLLSSNFWTEDLSWKQWLHAVWTGDSFRTVGLLNIILDQSNCVRRNASFFNV